MSLHYSVKESFPISLLKEIICTNRLMDFLKMHYHTFLFISMCDLFQIWPVGINAFLPCQAVEMYRVQWLAFSPMLLRLAPVTSLRLDLPMLKAAFPCVGYLFTYTPKLTDSCIKFS